MQYPTGGRVIRTMCSGRIAEKFIMRAFEKGASAVLVSGCHLQDCHYINANQWTVKRVNRWKRKLEKMGVNPERLQLEWISAAEADRFASKMKEMHEIISGVTEKEISKTMKMFKAKV